MPTKKRRTGGHTRHLSVRANKRSASAMGDADQCLEAASTLMLLFQGRSNPTSATASTGDHSTLSPDEEAAWILIRMRQGRLDHNSSVAPNGSKFTAAGLPGDSILDSFNSDTDSQAITVDLVTREKEVVPTARNQWAQEMEFARDEKPARDEKLARVKEPARVKKPVKNQLPVKSQPPAKAKQPAKITKPAEKTWPDQRPSMFDDPALVRRSNEIDNAIGFPGGHTKENSEDWLKQKIGYIQRETQERNAKSWVQLEAGQNFVAEMRKGVLPGSNEVPPHLLEFSDDEATCVRTRAQRRTSKEAHGNDFSSAKKEQSRFKTYNDDETTVPKPTRNPEPQSGEGSAQSNTKGQQTAKRRTRANQLDTNLGAGWDFKGVTPRGRPSKARD